jgi:hypothetical protein
MNNDSGDKRMTKALKPLRPLTAIAAAAASLALTAPARAIDLDAGDYTALPAGTNALVVYGQHATRDKLYSKGDQVPIHPGLDSDIGILRGVHFMEVGGLIIDPQFLLPFGRLKGKDDTAALGSSSGVGDLILASAIWFTQPGAKTHFAVTPYLWLPTGKYNRNDPLSLGENRYKFALQVGSIHELAPGVNLDLAADVTFYGKNTDANNGAGGATTLKQKPLLALQSHLRYQLSPTLDLRGGLFYTAGGETKLGGVDQDNRQATTKFNVGAGWFVAPTTQLLATYGRDIKAREGFKVNNQLNLRLLTLF